MQTHPHLFYDTYVILRRFDILATWPTPATNTKAKMTNYNDTVIIPGRYNVVKFDANNNVMQVISLNDPHWLSVYGKENMQSDDDESVWAAQVWDGQDDDGDDYTQENDTFRWSIVNPQGQVVQQGGLKTLDANGDCIWLD